MELALPVGRTPLVGDLRRRAWSTQVSNVSEQKNEKSLFHVPFQTQCAFSW